MRWPGGLLEEAWVLGRAYRGITAVLALAMACGCAPRPASVAPPPLAEGLGAVQLVLEGFGAPPRATQVAPTFAQALLHIDGATMPLEKTKVASFRLGGTEVAIGNVPIGRNMVFVVEGLDAMGQPIPGARYGTVVDVTPGATVSARVGALTTPRAEVVLALLAQDRAAGRTVDQALSVRLDDEALQSRLESERSRLGLVHPALFDAPAIARAIAALADPAATSSVAPPSDLTAYARAPGRIRFRLEGLPSASRAAVWLDDPISPRQQNLAGGTYELLPVAPGAWTLSAEAPGGFAVTVPVTVTAGLTGTVPEVVLDLGRWEALPALSKPLAAALCVPMTLDGAPTLVLAGGMDAVPAPVTAYATSSCYAFDGTRVSPLPPLPEPRSFAAGAVSNGQLYVLGGLTEAGALAGDVHAFDGRTWSTVATSSTVFAGAASLAYGSSIYLFGGSLGDAGKEFDVAALKFRDAPGMALRRVAPASAVYQDKLYVFGGGNQDALLAGSEVFDPRTGRWTAIANVPVARFGARAAVLGNRIYVVGGVDSLGVPSDRVDVYDPAGNSWAPFGALATPRGVPAVGALDGQLFVLGGCDGKLGSLLAGAGGVDKPVPLGAIEVLRP